MSIQDTSLCFLLVASCASVYTHNASGMDNSICQSEKAPEIIKPAVEILKVLSYSGLILAGSATFYATHVLYPFFYDVAKKPRNKLRIQAIAWSLRMTGSAMVFGGFYGLASEWPESEDTAQSRFTPV